MSLVRPRRSHGSHSRPPPHEEPVPAPLRRSTSRRRRKFGAFLLLLGWALVVLFPIYWLFVTSFKTPYQVDKGPFYIPFVDFQPTLDAWHYILVELGNDTLRPYVNTVIVGLSSAAIALVLGSFAAYALVRFTYRPRVGIIGLFIGCIAFAFDRDGARRTGPDRARLPRSAIFVILAQTIGRRFKRALGQQRHRVLADLAADPAADRGGRSRCTSCSSRSACSTASSR